MKVLIWTKHPGDILGEAIDFLTHGNAQHAGFLRRDGKTVHEAYFPKVRDRLLLPDEIPFVLQFSLEGVLPEMEDAFEALFDANIKAHEKYDLPDLFRYELNIPFPDQAHDTICSVYDITCIRQVAPLLSPLVRCDSDQVSPRDLLISPRLIEEPWLTQPEQPS